MKCFQENCCRLCSKTFCCKKCRVQHEEQVHKVNSDCEICIYGRTTITEAPISLLRHIKTAHWPLHCVFCKKIFASLDELIPHDKCVLRMEQLQRTPKTPVTPATEREEPSPEITPFYKSIKGTQQLGPILNAMVMTSTPLVHKDEIVKSDKITPANQSEINSIHKSNLKLTRSSSLSDSKKSERRVTFSETPSIAEPYKKPKHLPLTKKSDEGEKESADSTDDSYASVDEEIYKTAPTSNSEEKENIDNEVLVFDKCNTNDTLWESAVTKLEISGSNIPESVCNQSNNFNVSLQINVFNSTVKSEDCSNINVVSEEESLLNKSTNIWTSMTNIVKSVVNNISMTAQNSFSSVGVKRSQPDNDYGEAPSLKRLKLTELKCRRPIRPIPPLYEIRLLKPKYVDKATQTDECWM